MPIAVINILTLIDDGIGIGIGIHQLALCPHSVR
jgi:hypothetical protein